MALWDGLNGGENRSFLVARGFATLNPPAAFLMIVCGHRLLLVAHKSATSSLNIQIYPKMQKIRTNFFSVASIKAICCLTILPKTNKIS